MTKNEKPMLENAKPHQHSPPAGDPGGPLSPCGRGLRRLTSALVSRSWVRGSAPSVTHHAAFVQMETLRQYNLAQRREDKKKESARAVILHSYFGDDADVTGILIPPWHGGAVGVAEQQRDRRRRWRGTRRLSQSRGHARSKRCTRTSLKTSGFWRIDLIHW